MTEETAQKLIETMERLEKLVSQFVMIDGKMIRLDLDFLNKDWGQPKPKSTEPRGEG